MSWEYFDSAKYGLVGVGAVDWLRGEGCYEWQDTTVFFNPKDRLFYWEFAGGCSCNGPLEDVTCLADLQSGNLQALSKHLSEEYISQLEYREDKDGVLALEVSRVIEAAVRAEGEN